MKKGPESIRHHLKSSATLRKLHEKFREQEQLLIHVKKQLPAELKNHCTSIQRQGQTLIIGVDAAVWATKMRFLTRQITQSTGARQVRIHVSTPETVAVRQSERPVVQPRRSSQAITVLDNAARHEPDEKLKKALQRLADAIRQEPKPAGRRR